MHIFWCFVLVHLLLVSFAHVFAYSLNSGSKYSNRPNNNRAFSIRTIFSEFFVTNLWQIQLPSLFLQSHCSHEQLFARENHHLFVILRIMIFCQKGIHNRFFFRYWPLIIHPFNVFLEDLTVLWSCSRARFLKSREQAKESNIFGETEEVFKFFFNRGF